MSNKIPELSIDGAMSNKNKGIFVGGCSASRFIYWQSTGRAMSHKQRTSLGSCSASPQQQVQNPPVNECVVSGKDVCTMRLTIRAWNPSL